jgi:DNA-directed RNA polymerase specialized sigma24 family protein
MQRNESQSDSRPSGAGERDILMAILALLVEEREGRSSQRPNQVKTELLLASAGLPAATIAVLLNKQVSAVRMTLSRARTAREVSAAKVPSRDTSEKAQPRSAKKT